MRTYRGRIVLGCLCLLLPLISIGASAAHGFRAHAAAFVLPSYGGVQPSPSIFGIDSYTIDNNHSNFKHSFRRARLLGARWLHFTAGSIHWAYGRPNWSAMDWEIEQTRERHMGVLLSLGGAAGACSFSGYKAKPTHCVPTTAGDLSAYKKFLTTELLRYRKDVTYYESWTEPNHAKAWQNAYPATRAEPNPAQYAAVLRTQYSVFQSVNKRYHLHLKLLFGGSNEFSAVNGTPGVTAVLPFTHAVLENLQGQKAFDGIALHAYVFPANKAPADQFYTNVSGIPIPRGAPGPYANCSTGTPPNNLDWCNMTWSEQLRAYEQEFANHGYPSEPLWLTEFGWPGNATQNTATFPDYAVQNRNLRAAYTQVLNLPFVQGAFWYNLYDYKPGIPSCKTSPGAPLCNPDPAPFGYYGLLKYSQSEKPAGGTFKSIAAANPHT